MHAPRFAQALSLLLQSHLYTLDLSCDRWDLAVEREELHAAGLANSDLRWLLAKGYVLQAAELIPPPDGQRRAFAAHTTLALNQRSCFILTPQGVAFVSAGEAHPPQDVPPCEPSAVLVPALPATNGVQRGTPNWDKDRRQLRLGGHTVKHYKVPAANQEIILAVFEEEGWPHRIDDPLPLTGSIEPKRRLHDTINSLNRNQRESLLRFSGDGNGEGVCWETANTLSSGGGVNGERHPGVPNRLEEMSYVDGMRR